MKIDTLLKLGSLAVGVAQDEKVRELLKMAHGGAKRRGLFNPPQQGHMSPPPRYPWGNPPRRRPYGW